MNLWFCDTVKKERGFRLSMKIRVVALCVFLNDEKILVEEKTDRVTGETYYKPLGGGVEFGEHSLDALKREIKEELGTDITLPQYLGTLETVFVLHGEKKHRVSFVYDARFVDPSFYKRTEVQINDDGKNSFAVWKPLSFFITKQGFLHPDGLLKLLMK